MSRNIVEKIFLDAGKVMNSCRTPVQHRYGEENAITNVVSTPQAPSKSTFEGFGSAARTTRLPGFRNSPIRRVRAPQGRTAQTGTTEGQANAAEPDISVFARIRPVLDAEEPSEYEISGSTIIAKPSAKGSQVRKQGDRTFKFTEVLGEGTRQYDVFRLVAMPALKKFAQGVDSLILAYGATGAGKTYTVQGTPQEPGLFPRVANILLGSSTASGTERALYVSCVEIYNEKVLDLFGDGVKPLRIGRDGFGTHSVKDVVEFEIKTENDVNRILSDIEGARRRCTTKFNTASSRSHCVFMLRNVVTPIDGKGDKRPVKCTRFSIVDLAGSERVSSDDTNAQAVSEACSINKSMLVLGRCIRKLAKGGSGQAPYRESKLTELFRDFFEPGDRAKMLSIIVNAAPTVAQCDDTMFALQFASGVVGEGTLRSSDESDSSFVIHTVDLSDKNPPLAHIEARIRQEVHEEHSEILRKIQDDYRNQVEEIRGQSGQPYIGKLQQALGQQMKRNAGAEDLRQVKKDTEIERQRTQELEKAIADVVKQTQDVKMRAQEATKRQEMLESNITKMINGTKMLHERFVQQRDVLTKTTAEKEAEWKNRVQALEREIAELS